MQVQTTTSARGLRLIGAAALIGALPVGSVAYVTQGVNGLLATAVAVVICCAAAMSSLLVLQKYKGTSRSVHAILGGMALRMLPPLLAVVMLPSMSPRLAAGGLAGQIVIFYLLTLAVETFSAVRVLKSPSKPVAGSV